MLQTKLTFISQETFTSFDLFFFFFSSGRTAEQQTQAWHLKQLSVLRSVHPWCASADKINPVIWYDDKNHSLAEIAWTYLTFKACFCGRGKDIFWVSRHYFDPQEAGSRQTDVAAPLPPRRPVSYTIKIRADCWRLKPLRHKAFPASCFAFIPGCATETHSAVTISTPNEMIGTNIQFKSHQELIRAWYHNIKNPHWKAWEGAEPMTF